MATTEPRKNNKNLRSELQIIQTDLKEALKQVIDSSTKLEQLKHKQAHQAALQLGNHKKINRKVSGRKKGIGNFKYRMQPKIGEVTECLTVPILELFCPKCGIELLKEPSGIRLAWLTYLSRFKPSVTQYRLEQKIRVEYRIKVEGTHLLIDLVQQNGTIHRIGLYASNPVYSLQYEKDILSWKVPRVLLMTNKLPIIQSVITQNAICNILEGKVIQNGHQKLRLNIKASSMTNTDDTSWQVEATTVSQEQFGISAKRGQAILTKQLLGRTKFPTRVNEQLSGDFNKHHHKNNLLGFLEQSEVSPMNNAAERVLPFMILCRLKIWSRMRVLEAH